MANILQANGFQQYQGTGVTPSFEQTQLAISTSNTTPIFFGDPVTQAAGTTGVGTGYITQGYGPVTLTVAATAITVTAAGVMTVTFTGTTSTSGNLPTSPNTWSPPIGSTMTITGATTTSNTTNLNGTFIVTSSTTGTAVTNLVNSTGSSITSTASGVVTIYVPIAGVFVGCKYLSVSQKRPIWSNYWPGSDANGDVTAYVITDPLAQFSVCTANSNTTATAVGLSNIGQNISFNYTSYGATATNGNTANGLSTFFADQYSLAANSGAGYASNQLLPFRIIALQNYVPGANSPLQTINGNDWTTPYNRIVVGFNNAMPRQFFGI
jgi:hypothetical protein